MLSRQYYAMLARVISDSLDAIDNSNQARMEAATEALEDFARDLCVELIKDNPRFSEEKFLSACGIDPEGLGVE